MARRRIYGDARRGKGRGLAKGIFKHMIILSGSGTVTAPGGGVLPITDSYNRVDGAIGSTDTGQVYTLSGTWSVQSNVAKGPGANRGHAIVDAGTADCTIQVTFSTFASGMGLIFRRLTGSSYLYAHVITTTGLQLFKYNSGATQIGASVAHTGAAGDVMKVVLSGANIQVYMNGVLQISETDSFNQTVTWHGLYQSSAALSPRWDNFSIA